eukprot:CAMPEP_0198733838 /NCGR_PEP_ID=MMETSP1475-20131203/48630_1 /TAXON_ID= ORGANISM="Unidentified sp., Strain CCMP1999" /NCGR_SAMPLE_ID=MMETSP1475 /ASSEMBLY_ACC=CAM_ASM_001111 /LENGTH=166 /DNA_ID=CAMNT_0044497199 /DNA_START=96 /DNA_END=592 /DNA_ORIENTATION=+
MRIILSKEMSAGAEKRGKTNKIRQSKMISVQRIERAEYSFQSVSLKVKVVVPESFLYFLQIQDVVPVTVDAQKRLPNAEDKFVDAHKLVELDGSTPIEIMHANQESADIRRHVQAGLPQRTAQLVHLQTPIAVGVDRIKPRPQVSLFIRVHDLAAFTPPARLSQKP